MFHACVQKFDVMERERKNLEFGSHLKWLGLAPSLQILIAIMLQLDPNITTQEIK
jgi:hypothetical protein